MPLRRFTLRAHSDAGRFDLFALARSWRKQAERTNGEQEVSDASWFTPAGLQVELASDDDVGMPVVLLETLADTAEARAELAELTGDIEELFEPIGMDEAIGRYRDAGGPVERVLLLPVVAATSQPDAPSPEAVGIITEALDDDEAGVRMAAAVAARYLPTQALAEPLRRAMRGDPDADVRESAEFALLMLTGPGEPDAGYGDRLRRVVLFNRDSGRTFAQFAAGQGWRAEGESSWRTRAGVRVSFEADERLERDLVTVSGEPAEVARVDGRIRAVFLSVTAGQALAWMKAAEDDRERVLALRLLAGTAPASYDAETFRCFLPFFRDPRPSMRGLAAGFAMYPGWPQFLPVLDWLARADPDDQVRMVAEGIHRAIGDGPGAAPVTRYYTGPGDGSGRLVGRRIEVGPEPVDERIGVDGVWRTSDVIAEHAGAALVEISEDEARRLVTGR